MAPGYQIVGVAIGGSLRYVIRTFGQEGPDRLVADNGRVVSWGDVDDLRFFADRRDWELQDQPRIVDLDAALDWIRDRESIDPQVLLEAWNVSWAVANSVDTRLAHFRRGRETVFDKLFWAASTTTTRPAGSPFDADWPVEDRDFLRQVLAEGIALTQAVLWGRG